MELKDANSPTTRLLTLLNVSALKSKKRPTENPYPCEKLNRRKLPSTAEPQCEPELSGLQNATHTSDGVNAKQDMDGCQHEQNDSECEHLHRSVPRRLSRSVFPQAHNLYDEHFGPNPEILTEHSRTLVDAKQWKSSREKIGKLNAVASVLPEVSLPSQRAKKTAVRSHTHISLNIFMAAGPGTFTQSFCGSAGQTTSRYFTPPILFVVPVLL